MNTADQNRRILLAATILGAIAALLWLTLVLPYLPGPSTFALPINIAHFGALVITALIVLFALISSIGIGLIAVFRRNREMAWLTVLLVGFGFLSFMAVNTNSWWHTFARQRAIASAQPIIVEIEQHKLRRGEYPKTVDELGPLPRTNVIGISGYTYERVENEFELSFRIDDAHFNWEMVMYRPSGKYKGHGDMPEVSREGAWGYYVFD